MIKGQVERVNAKLEARISIDIANINSPESGEEISVTLDTGASVYLMLPRETIHRLGLTFLRQTPVEFANDTTQQINVYVAAVSWHRKTHNVPVFESNRQSLLGMGLLEGSRLTVDARAGGDVIIEEIESDGAA